MLFRSIYFTHGGLAICAATASSAWTDWQVVYADPGPYINEMLGDVHRFKQDGILSVMVQNTPSTPGASTPLRILDFTFSDAPQ